MKELKRVEIDDEVIYFRKDLLGWHVVYPWKIDGKINWKNFISGGNWWRLLIIFFMVLIILGCIYEYSIVLKSLNGCMDKLKLFNIII